MSARGAPDETTPHAQIRLSVLKAYAQPDGGVEVALSQQWLLATYARWELEQRAALGSLMGVPTAEVMSDLFGDLRRLRNDVAHNGGVVEATTAAKLKVMTRFSVGDIIVFSPDDYIKISASVDVYPAPPSTP